MTGEDISRFYAVTPIWLWPVLWLRLRWLGAYMARRQAEGRGGLARIFTDGRGGISVQWIVHEEKLSHNGCSSGTSFDSSDRWQLADLDGRARGFEAACGWILRRDVTRGDVCPALANAPLEPG